MLKSIKNMLSTLNEEEIVYCHWKSNQHLKEALNGDTDLDLLFRADQRSKVDEVLNRCGLKRFRATPSMQYNAIEDFLGFDKDTASIWHVHLHHRLTLGEKHLKGYTTPWGDRMLEHRVYNENYGIFCADPNDEYFILLLRLALKLRWRDYFRKIGQGDRLEINWLQERTTPEKVLELAGQRLGSAGLAEYTNLLGKDLNQYRELFKLQDIVRSTMRDFSSYNRLSSYINRCNREAYWLLGGLSRRLGLQRNNPGRRISPSGGAVVAVLGADGTGKSTTVNYLVKEFGKKIDVKRIYLGSGDGSSSFLRRPLRPLAKRVSQKRMSQGESRLPQEPGRFRARAYRWARGIWAITLAWEKDKKLRAITKARNNGMLVIADRYPQTEKNGISDGPLLSDYIGGPSVLLSKIAEWELSIYRKAYINPPDLVIKLTVPTEISLERKPGLESVIDAKRSAIEKIRLSAISVTVDTNRDKAVTFGEIMEQIWKIV